MVTVYAWGPTGLRLNVLVCTGMVWFDLLHSGTLWPDFLDYASDRFGLICCVSGLGFQGFVQKS